MVSTLTTPITPLVGSQAGRPTADVSDIIMQTGRNLQGSISDVFERRRQEKERQRQEQEKGRKAMMGDYIDSPVYSMSDAVQKDQLNKIEAFNNLLTNTYQKSGLRPSDEDLLKLHQEKIKMLAYQDGIKSDQAMAAKAIQEIEMDKKNGKNILDQDHFNNEISKWQKGLEDGTPYRLNYEELIKPAKIDMDSFAGAKQLPYFKAVDTVDTDTVTGKKSIVKMPQDLSQDDKVDIAMQQTWNDPRAVRTFNEEWQNLPPETINKYVDVYGQDKAAKMYHWDKYGSKMFLEDQNKKLYHTPVQRGAKVSDLFQVKTNSGEESPYIFNSQEQSPYAYSSQDILFKNPPSSTFQVKEEVDENGNIKMSNKGRSLKLRDFKISYLDTEGNKILPTGERNKETGVRLEASKNAKKKAYLIGKDSDGLPITVPVTGDILDQLTLQYKLTPSEAKEFKQNIKLELPKEQKQDTIPEPVPQKKTSILKKAKNIMTGNKKELRGTEAQLADAASKRGLTITEYKGMLEKQGYKIITQ